MKKSNHLNFRIKEMVGDIEEYPIYVIKKDFPPFRDNLQTRKPDYEANIAKKNSMAEGLPQHP